VSRWVGYYPGSKKENKDKRKKKKKKTLHTINGVLMMSKKEILLQ
jgi:hypothetical protein